MDNLGDPLTFMMKAGDDLRQDQLTVQMFRIMDRLWLAAGLDLKMSPYVVLDAGAETGMIEVVPHAATSAAIQKEYGGVKAAFSEKPLLEWLKKHNPNEADLRHAIRDFARSCAGYCVATYVLGIGDRHNDNVMCTKSGLLFHIDFGRFLGNTEKFAGVSRDRAPFVFTPEFLYAMGGSGSDQFKQFVELCCKAYNVLRAHANIFINLFAMMLSTGIPELREEADINYLRDAFSLGLTDEQAAKKMESLINESLKSKATQLNNAIHIFAHPDKDS
jgi:phosphatidylinositol-4,5-bisphosphate 3-kinase catalytic subunit alpha/beta/delta